MISLCTIYKILIIYIEQEEIIQTLSEKNDKNNEIYSVNINSI